MANNKSVLSILETADTTFSLYHSELDETYHSKHGALQESMHVFIRNGIELFPKKNLNILEIGLGTGLNAALTKMYAEEHAKKVHYIGIEAFPVPHDLLIQVSKGYSKIIQNQMVEISECEWNVNHKLSESFTLSKLFKKAQDFQTELRFDLIYYDAFAPDKQESMWTFDILSQMADLLLPNGLFVTYCAKGQVKRDLKQAGLKVESREGPIGKREITLAFKV